MATTAQLRRYFSNAALSVPPVLYIRDNFYSLYIVNGTSMEPSLRDGDVVLVRKSDVYPAASWRRWISAGAVDGIAPPSFDDDNYDNDEDHNALRVLALDASSGRPIGDKWTGRTYLKPPTIHVLGSVVVYRAPDAARYPMGEYRIKRVVGLGGQLCRTSYSSSSGGERGGGEMIVRVPPFALWMEGDNKVDDDAGDEEEDEESTGVENLQRCRSSLSLSVDSRAYGPVCKNNVIGVAERIVWPPSRWGKIPSVDPSTSATMRSWWI
ncbi:hypothetical protein ACHAXA_008210 [Cyclostephanos tholiformis]|uniref:Peptidase S26 domain-containing protein n=1 Tax=Cyclostephanos tholiformis TaxID=382380 RepID=A0ABD3SCF5_9STRA